MPLLSQVESSFVRAYGTSLGAFSDLCLQIPSFFLSCIMPRVRFDTIVLTYSTCYVFVICSAHRHYHGPQSNVHGNSEVESSSSVPEIEGEDVEPKKMSD